MEASDSVIEPQWGEDGECSRTGSHVFCNVMLSNLLDSQQLSKELQSHRMLSSISSAQGSLLTGSQAELLYQNIELRKREPETFYKSYKSDYDYMIPSSVILIYRHIENLSLCNLGAEKVSVIWTDLLATRKLSLVLVTSNTLRPGYCFVCTTDHSDGTNNEMGFLTHQCLSVSSGEVNKAQNSPTHRYSPVYDNLSVTDNVYCFVSDVWPRYTESIFHRRHNVWPNQPLLDDIRAKCKVLIVAKAPSSCTSYPDSVFRFSFSILEVMLSRSLPDEVRHVYLTVKFLCKYHASLADTQLKTYYLKTVLYWMASEENITEWHSANFKINVNGFLDKIRKAFVKREILNFFVPEANLIKDLRDEDCHKISHELKGLQQKLCLVSYQCILNYDVTYPSSDGEMLNQARECFYKSRMLKDRQLAVITATEARRMYEEVREKAQEFCTYVYIVWLVEHGLVLWELKNDIGAFVSWLNALVLYFTSIDDIFMLPANMYKHKFPPEPILRLPRYFGDFEDYTFSLIFILAYHVATKCGLASVSVQHIVHHVKRFEQCRKKTWKDGTDEYVEISSKVYEVILKYCSASCAERCELDRFIETEKKTYTLRQVRKNVYNVCEAACEYVQLYLPSPPPSRRRQSFSGISAASGRRKTLGTSAIGRYIPGSSHVLSRSEAEKYHRQFPQGLVTDEPEGNRSLAVVSKHKWFYLHHHQNIHRRRHSYCGTSVVDYGYKMQDLEVLERYLLKFGLTVEYNSNNGNPPGIVSQETCCYLAEMTQDMLNCGCQLWRSKVRRFNREADDQTAEFMDKTADSKNHRNKYLTMKKNHVRSCNFC